ncbi:hypothetical protein FGG08_006640 [Glutinoglossum americanum]|uniref:MARVEL domain-containing protein n=1 Tax=Glutinoglossum americanum TaxID=1670608 RepID=A0A9P8L055_9PEZI|nr:hypothetical protein FGG08_006640 [Glutinoglossum americanum]
MFGTISTVFFIWWRFMQIVTLIPTLGMLAWFIHGYVTSQTLAPDFILVLFIGSVLGSVWAIYTLFAHSHTTHSSYFVAFIDLCFVGTFIASAWELREFSNADCSGPGTWYISLGVFGQDGVVAGNDVWALDFKKDCAMLKACFAFAIMNCFFWLFTAWFLLFMHKGKVEEVVVERRHRHGHGRHRSRSHRQPFV